MHVEVVTFESLYVKRIIYENLLDGQLHQDQFEVLLNDWVLCNFPCKHRHESPDKVNDGTKRCYKLMTNSGALSLVDSHLSLLLVLFLVFHLVVDFVCHVTDEYDQNRLARVGLSLDFDLDELM